MNTKNTLGKSIALYVCSAVMAVFTGSCTGDDELIPIKPRVALSVTDTSLEIPIGEQLEFVSGNLDQLVYEEEWILNDSLVASGNRYVFEAVISGKHTLVYRAFNDGGEVTRKFEITVPLNIRPVTGDSNRYVTELFEYRPAPGQFMNKSPGNFESAEGILGKTGMVTLGAWGGSIVLGFDHTVINREGEPDILFANNAMSNFSEPGIIYVMADENGNGLPDDTWYEIKGSAHDMEGATRDYEVTYYRPGDPAQSVPWTDNRGNSGEVAVNAFHQQPYYPEWIEEDSYTLKGTLLPSVNIDMSNPSYITSAPFDYGYADNIQGGDEIDISDAMDENGDKVSLEGIDFIRVQTGIQANMGWLGELSTEILGVSDLNMP
ncbi:cell surface protein [Sinomicrobium soli]|uniref:cell surface protein n=1 Tax=Sinomicrobium sp. N-1-3-6 TaxID=2219864 RepID=UPI000DCC1269|nr:cell surface protein [Sinomicrobium sp. N-1-3-6]RAV30621.1 cell surface protein [Sinomicrobium sp. N-1-3-6]